VGRVPLFRLLLIPPEAPIREVMESDPLYVEVDLDQEEVAQFMMTHDLVSLPVVDHRHRLLPESREPEDVDQIVDRDHEEARHRWQTHGDDLADQRTVQCTGAGMCSYSPPAGFAGTERTWPGGAEFLVLDGACADAGGEYRAGTWLRLPPGSRQRLVSATGGTLYLKSGHLPVAGQR